MMAREAFAPLKTSLPAPKYDTRCYMVAEYLTLEKSSSVRHEYRGGEIIEMAGGTPTHALPEEPMEAEVTTETQGEASN